MTRQLLEAGPKGNHGLPVCAFILVAATACSDRTPPAPPPAPLARRIPAQAEAPTTSPETAPSAVYYVEGLLGGASPDEPLPMIVTLHGMGADPMKFSGLLAHYPGKARLLIPYGLPYGGGHFWYLGQDRAAGAREAADRLAPWLSELVAARPTVGKPIVMGYSQGALVAYALAIAHPELTQAVFPVSGVLLPALRPSAPVSGERPVVQAFHGSDDPVFPVAQARESVNALRAAGFRAELHEYPHVSHALHEAELRDLLSAMAAAARP